MRGLNRTAGIVCGAMFFVTGATASPKPLPARAVMHTTVLPLSEGLHLPGSGTTGYWIPRSADLKGLEASLPPSLSGYYRQYLGITLQGKRVIYINGFSAGTASEFIGGASDWHRHAVVVEDGGTSFFHATYDPKTRKFTGPVFNGFA